MPRSAIRFGTRGSLRLLLAGTVVLPVGVFIIGAYLAYDGVVERARADLVGDVAVLSEQAERVFETQLLVARRVDELVGPLDAAALAGHERTLHEALAREFVGFPEVETAWVLDASGQRVVSSVRFPVDHDFDYSRRGYFSALRAAEVTVTIDRVESRQNEAKPYVLLAIRRGGGDGPFNGVVAVGVSPEFFREFQAKLLHNSVDFTAGLFRPDGGMLARYAGDNEPEPSGARSGRFARTVEQGSNEGFISATSEIDRVGRLAAYRRLPGFPVFVTAGRTWSSIMREWRGLMLTHLYFGLPATVGLFLLGLLALRRAERESAALRALRSEVARREQIEDVLRQSMKMDAIGQLTGGIAHDFNNLLTAIGGSVELLLRQVSDTDQRTRRLGEAALQGIRRAATLTHRLLAFSRQQPLDIHALDVNRLVAGLSELLRRTLGEAVAIETVLAGGLWRARTDANQLENALLNLAVNARDAMAEGGRLTIETANAHLDEGYAAAHAEVTAGQYVMLAVTDTGVGMPPDVVARAFEPFFTTKPTGSGTGLGLSMVYGFVKQSSGHVKIYSESGVGTTIRIYLPRATAADADFTPPEATGRAPARAAAGTGETLLVVEDDLSVRTVSVEALRDFGYRVLVASDAAEALTLLECSPEIALLFTDVGLPGGVNGRKLADAARALRPGLPVLFTTGYTRNAIIHNGVLDPEVDFIAKPLDLATLESKLRAMLDARATAGSCPDPA